MTPKEKARELIDRFESLTDGEGDFIFTHRDSKQCALIAVDEIIEAFNSILKEKTNPDSVMGEYIVSKIEFYQAVKTCIPAL